MALVLVQGSVEFLEVQWTDTDGVLTTLNGTAPVFDVKGPTGYSYYTSQAATLNTLVPMTEYCLIDTTTSPALSPSAGQPWLPGDYKLYAKLTAGPGSERPRLGPFVFTVAV